jgi:glutathione S-transferase
MFGSGEAPYTLYVIPGSHACRSAMLMLDHKRAPYRRVDVLTLTHPVAVRRHGFDAGGQTRTAGERRSLPLRFGDLLGTVPALAAGKERISTNHGIARFLDERHPARQLLPAEAAQRADVERAERWANETLQMLARRLTLAWAVREPAAAAEATADGRLGCLLYRRQLARRLITPAIGRVIFATSPQAERELLSELPGVLDRVDRLIEEKVIGQPEPNVADFMIAPSLALILYRPDLGPTFDGRPALELVNRLLPEPVSA